MDPVVSIRGFSKSYGDVRAVEDVSLEIPGGMLFGLIGPDGAGKTTTMRALVTLLQPDAGDLRVAGFDTRAAIPDIRAIIGYMPQRFSLYPDLSVDQNISFFADLFGVPKDDIPERKRRLYQFSRLEPFASRLAGKLSGGMKQKLALSCTLIHNPVVLVLDEPTTGVDPVSRSEFWVILRELTAQGVTIVVSTPYMDEALQCDAIAIMHEGRVLAQGTPRDLTASMRDIVYVLEHHTLVHRADEIRSVRDVTSVQAFGDSLHVTADPGVPQSELERAIGATAGMPVSLRRIEPSLEDVFIALVREGGHRER